MKLVLASILILLVFVQSFSNWFIYLEYQSNKTFIADKLCINKTKPKLHCNGKCQMMKKMAEEEQNSSHSPNPPRLRLPEVPIQQNNTLAVLHNYKQNKLVYSNFYQLKEYNAPFRAIFHPPA
jgi:hypothetical protein